MYVNTDPAQAQPDPTTDLTWRDRACHLAHERKLNGQAYFIRETGGIALYGCHSASKPFDRMVIFDTVSAAISCECAAGTFNHPCAHAGAVLLFICRLAPGGTPRQTRP